MLRCALIVGVVFLAPSPVRAQEATDEPGPPELFGPSQDGDYAESEEGPVFVGRVVAEPPEPERPVPREESPDRERTPHRVADRRHWDHALSRWFLAGEIDVGALYLRPRFSAGWGKPHSAWLGTDVNPLVTGEGVGAYGGLRAELPEVDLRVGARYFFTFRRSFLSPQEDFDGREITDRSGPPSRYLSLEAQLTTKVPIGFGSLFGELTGTFVALVDDGWYVFEEQLRVVVDPPWVWGARGGWGIPFGPGDAGSITFIGQILGVPGRDATVVRAGVEAGFLLWEDFEIRARVIPPLVSPDTLGAVQGDSYQVGFRYRFASGT